MTAAPQDENSCEDPEPVSSPDAEPGGPTGCGVSELARLAGCSRTTIQAWMRKPDFPPKFPDGSLNPFKAGAWHERRLIESQLKEAAAADTFDATDGTSPELEKWRRARRIMAELDLAERKKSIVDQRTFMTRLLGMAAIRRRTNDLLQRRFGREAHDILARGLQEEELAWHAIFEEHYEHHLQQTGKQHALDEGNKNEPNTDSK